MEANYLVVPSKYEVGTNVDYLKHIYIMTVFLTLLTLVLWALFSGSLLTSVL